jgi:hypothetical protein
LLTLTGIIVALKRGLNTGAEQVIHVYMQKQQRKLLVSKWYDAERVKELHGSKNKFAYG